MNTSLIETIIEGGCYWPKDPNGNGHSFAIPNKTRFEIAMDGPESHKCVNGMCCDGYYMIQDGAHKGEKFSSANKAVSAVREIPSKSNNAFLYIRFYLNGNNVSADQLRHDINFKCDEIEEEALKIIHEILHDKHPQVIKGLDNVALLKKKAITVKKNPKIFDVARQVHEVFSPFSSK